PRHACPRHVPLPPSKGVGRMKFKSLFAAALLVAASSSLALAQSDCTKIVPPSPWGPNDQTGATNRVTAAVTKAAASETKDGKFINQNNMTKLGLEHLKSFATRGVLVDMVKVFKAAGKFKGNAACKRDCLDKGTVITGADIQAGLKMYNVTLREGDIVVVHTG